MREKLIHLLRDLPSGDLLFESLWSGPKALLIAALQKQTGKHILVVTGDDNKLALDIAYFTGKEPLEFPAWEALPSEEIPPSSDIVGRRLDILGHLLSTKTPEIILTPLQGALQPTPSPKNLKPNLFTWKKGDEFPFDLVDYTLSHLGYTRCPIVSDKGEFAMRGSIVDIFPASAYTPFRIEFFDDEIDNIRSFDPGSQKSIEKLGECTFGPARESLDNASLLDYLGEPILLLDDLAALEDKYYALKNLPGAKELSIDHLLGAACRKVYTTKEPFAELSETGKMFDRTLNAKTVPHPFHAVPPLEELENTALNLHFLVSSDAEEKALSAKIEGLTLPPHTLSRGYLSSGFIANDLCLLPYPELTGRHKVHRQKWRQTYHTPASEFHELSPGDYVVHIHNGVGKYLGIEKQKSHEGVLTEFIVIEYAKGGKLFVPLAQSHLVSRYIGAHEAKPDLHTIGSTKWQRAKTTAQKAIIGYAKDLLESQAAREISGGHIFPPDSDDVLLFEEEFPFVETEDQLLAVAALKEDMASEKAMDRLICGDVGYGKTEVAMRAAFKAVVDGSKQVAILVPTTTLAMQHYDSFRSRMSSFPIRIGVLSRFVPKKEQDKTLEGLRTGAIDIVIGTHRLISQDIAFNDLGMIIIDEEQRFGVRAKEHLKKFKAGVDCLTLSATPIPRTLYMSLIGARDLSTINTPPQDRLPIKTIIAERDDTVIKNALLREKARDGQSFFIHNRVESIHETASHLRTLVPDSRVTVGHGQMGADALDKIFHEFSSGHSDIFVATTIVETGIDIPNANTILIDRADTFGIADLYQLRGRVGRWNRPAYAYFLVPKNRELPEIAQKRLQALVETSGFGGGMKLAMRDLEIRGAGDLLGTKQSGHVSSIGFHLYCKLLKKTIAAIKHKKPTSFVETKIEFPFDAQLGEHYIPETSIRLEIYHRLGDAEKPEEIDEIGKELLDRFGPLPDPAKLLLTLSRIRIRANALGYTLLKYHKQTLQTHRPTRKGVVDKKNHIVPFFKTPEEFEEAIVSLLV